MILSRQFLWRCTVTGVYLIFGGKALAASAIPYTASPIEQARVASTRIAFSGPHEWNFERLRQVLVDSKAETVGEFLSAIDKNDPRFFDRWTMFHNSRSLQESSIKDPRVIAFPNDGGVFITFNGDPAQKGYSNVEIMQFDPIKGYELREIQFPKEGLHRSFTDQEVEQNLGFAEVSKANPQSCAMCHSQVEMRPIWDAYSTWPGSFGAEDDVWSVDDLAHLKDNTDYWSTHPRYKSISGRFGPQQNYEIDPYVSIAPKTPRDYRRNLMVSRLLSLQLTQLLARDAKAHAGMSEALRSCHYAFEAPENRLFLDTQARLKKLAAVYLTDPLFSPDEVREQTIFSSPSSMVSAIASILAAYGIDAVLYAPLQRRGENFEDGGNGFRYFDKVFSDGLGPSDQPTSVPRSDRQMNFDCPAFWREANARYEKTLPPSIQPAH